MREKHYARIKEWSIGSEPCRRLKRIQIRLKADPTSLNGSGAGASRARNSSRRRQNAMRGVLAPLTNVIGRVRPRSPSVSSSSSSDSDLDDEALEDLRPVGERIGHAFQTRPIYIERSNFAYVRAIPGGGELAYEDIAAEQLRALGLNPEVLVGRKHYWNVRERCWRFKYACAHFSTTRNAESGSNGLVLAGG